MPRSARHAPTTDAHIARLATRVGRRLLKTGRIAATAESCTGGWIAKAMTDIAGSSAWFVEGFVTYGNDAKVRRLGVPAALLKAHGAVSEAVARAMIRGALAHTQADVAVAVTGIAGPGGAVPDKPVGTVWLAWGLREAGRLRITTQLKHFRGDRDAVRRKTVCAALSGMWRLSARQ